MSSVLRLSEFSQHLTHGGNFTNVSLTRSNFVSIKSTINVYGYCSVLKDNSQQLHSLFATLHFIFVVKHRCLFSAFEFYVEFRLFTCRRYALDLTPLSIFKEYFQFVMLKTIATYSLHFI